jgi:pSer/pThr/pTyr-binding forkhead associated (FHA) protein
MSKKSTSYKSRTATAKKGRKHKSAILTIQNSCFSGLQISLNKKQTLLGSDLNCDVCLDHSLVSKEHAMILKSNSEYMIEDLNSQNGITINQKEAHRRKLKNGDIIEIGGFKMKFSQ